MWTSAPQIADFLTLISTSFEKFEAGIEPKIHNSDT